MLWILPVSTFFRSKGAIAPLKLEADDSVFRLFFAVSDGPSHFGNAKSEEFLVTELSECLA